MKNLKIGQTVYTVEDELGGRTIFKGIIEEYDKETTMYYINGEIDDWVSLNSIFTSKLKAKVS